MKHASLVLTAILFFSPSSQAQEKPLVLDVWPGKIPGETGKIGEEKFQDHKPGDKNPVKRLTNVTKPTITIFRPDQGQGHRGRGRDLSGRRLQHSRLGPRRRRSGGLAQFDRRHRHRPEVSCAAPARPGQGPAADRPAAGRPAGHEPGAQQGLGMEPRRQAHRHSRLLGRRPSGGGDCPPTSTNAPMKRSTTSTRSAAGPISPC